jgi:signal peptidase I
VATDRGRSGGGSPAPEGARTRPKSTVREYAEAIGVAILLALVIRTFIVQAFKIPSGSMLPTLEIGDHILVNKFLYGPRLELPLTNVSLGRLPGLRDPARGDVVVFVYPQDRSKDFIKRVVGLPGDVVEVRNRKVYVNGEEYDDPHAHFLGVRGGLMRGNLPPIYIGRAGDRVVVDGPVLRVNGTAIPLPDPQVMQRQYGWLAAAHSSEPVTVPENYYFMMGDNRDNSQDSRVWGPVQESALKGKAFLIYWSWNGRDAWVRWGRLGNLIR